MARATGGRARRRQERLTDAPLSERVLFGALGGAVGGGLLALFGLAMLLASGGDGGASSRFSMRESVQ
jgi:hypothetical protein